MSTRRKRSNPLQSDDLVTPEDLEQDTFSEVDSQEEAPAEEPTESPLPGGTFEETLETFTNIITEETLELPTDAAIEELTETPEPPVSTIEVVTETPEPRAPFKSRSQPLKPLKQRNIPRFSSFKK